MYNIIMRIADVKGIVKWEIFFSWKVGQLCLKEQAKRKFGL